MNRAYLLNMTVLNVVRTARMAGAKAGQAPGLNRSRGTNIARPDASACPFLPIEGMASVAEFAHLSRLSLSCPVFLAGASSAPSMQMTITVPSNLDDLTERIIGCAIVVHRALGPGLLESTYRECLLIELELAGLKAVREKSVPIYYRGRRIQTGLRIDILVDDCVVLELKAVDKTNPVFLAQVITYLKLTGCPAGLLMNFNNASLRAGLHRLDHPELRAAKAQLKSHLSNLGAEHPPDDPGVPDRP